MKHFRYNLGLATKICIFIVSAIWIAIAIFALLKLLNKSIYVSINPAFDIITIIFSLLCITMLIMLFYMNYQISNDGIKLKIGFFTVFRKKLSFSNIKSIIKKTKHNQLFVCGDPSQEKIFGTPINISPNCFEEFILQIKNKGVAFDYIEDPN